ncbi:MAG TPA: DUF4136 domain-containing protein [Cytophagaceae bacterium]
MRGIACLIIGFIIIAGCSKKTLIWKEDAVDVSHYRTYAFLPPGDTLFNTSLYNNILEDIIDDINNDLQKAGYVLRPEKPELLVMIHTNLDKDIQYLPAAYPYYSPGFYERPYFDAYYYYPDYPNLKGFSAGPEITEVEYSKGTVVIDFIDRKSGDIIWRGRSQMKEHMEVSNQQDIEEIAKGVKGEVETILNSLPDSRG